METFAGSTSFITRHEPLEIFRRAQRDALATVLPALGSSGKGIRDDLKEAFFHDIGGRFPRPDRMTICRWRRIVSSPTLSPPGPTASAGRLGTLPDHGDLGREGERQRLCAVAKHPQPGELLDVRAEFCGVVANPVRDQAGKKPGTGDPLHTQEPVTVASFRTWRGWRECVARDRCLTEVDSNIAIQPSARWPLAVALSP